MCSATNRLASCRLHRDRPEPEECPRAILRRRSTSGRDRRSGSRCGSLGEVRDRKGHVPWLRVRQGTGGHPARAVVVLAEAIEWILASQHEAAARETTDEAKRREHRRYQDAVLALSKAFALASASDEARDIRDEVASSMPSGRHWPNRRRAVQAELPERNSRSSRSWTAPSSRRRSSTFCSRRLDVPGHLHPVRRIPRRGTAA